MTELCRAILNRDVHLLRQRLEEHHDDPNRLGRPYTPLIQLVRQFIHQKEVDQVFHEMLDLFLKHGVEIDRTVCFDTALMHAVEAQNLPIMKILVEKGANVMANLFRLAMMYSRQPSVLPTFHQLDFGVVDELLRLKVPADDLTRVVMMFFPILSTDEQELVLNLLLPYLYSRDVNAHFNRQSFFFRLALLIDERLYHSFRASAEAIDRLNPLCGL